MGIPPNHNGKTFLIPVLTGTTNHENGVSAPSRQLMAGDWIPAFAGMTAVGAPRLPPHQWLDHGGGERLRSDRVAAVHYDGLAGDAFEGGAAQEV